MLRRTGPSYIRCYITTFKGIFRMLEYISCLRHAHMQPIMQALYCYVLIQMTRGTWKIIPARLAQALIVESGLSASLLKDISLGRDFCYILCNKCILLKHWRLFNKLICYAAHPNFPDGSIPAQACNLNSSWKRPSHAPAEKVNRFHFSLKTWSIWTLLLLVSMLWGLDKLQPTKVFWFTHFYF